MADNLRVAAHLASNVIRFGWYWGINRLMTREAGQYGTAPAYTPSRPIPPNAELMAEVRALLLRDAQAVRDGIHPSNAGPAEGLTEHLSRIREMLADLPDTVRRRHAQETGGAAALPHTHDLPTTSSRIFTTSVGAI